MAVRRLAALAASAFTLVGAMAVAAPAHATTLGDGSISLLRVEANGAPCLAPAGGFGSVVYAVGCGGAEANWEAFATSGKDSRGGYWNELLWWYGSSFGCLVPNWVTNGSPVVVTTCDGAADDQWYAWPLGSGEFELVNRADTNLVLNMAANGSLTVTNANYTANQRFWTS